MERERPNERNHKTFVELGMTPGPFLPMLVDACRPPSFPHLDLYISQRSQEDCADKFPHGQDRHKTPVAERNLRQLVGRQKHHGRVILNPEKAGKVAMQEDRGGNREGRGSHFFTLSDHTLSCQSRLLGHLEHLVLYNCTNTLPPLTVLPYSPRHAMGGTKCNDGGGGDCDK